MSCYATSRMILKSTSLVLETVVKPPFEVVVISVLAGIFNLPSDTGEPEIAGQEHSQSCHPLTYNLQVLLICIWE